MANVWILLAGRKMGTGAQALKIIGREEGVVKLFLAFLFRDWWQFCESTD
jgi:hypothetical protein